MFEVSLEVDGRKLLGWKRINIERELGAICGRFSLGLLDSWENLSQSWFIKPFSECRVFIDRDLVVTGYIDNVSISKTSTGTDITASGRDRTSDLIDCSAILTAYELPKVNLSQLTNKLLKGFPIVYIEETSPGKKFPFVHINPGSRIASILEEYAKYRGLFFLTDGQGSLILAKPGSKKSKVSLIIGENIKSFQIQYDTQQRFSKYTVMAQAQGEPEFFGVLANQIEGKAFDRGVPRYRPLGFIADTSATGEDGNKRAQWEAAVRAAKSTGVTVEVVGWRQGADLSSPLWEVNSLVDVKIPEVGLNGEFLISSVRFSIDANGGTITTIGIESPDAYKPEPLRDPGMERYLNFENAPGDD